VVSHGQLAADVDAEVEHCGRRFDEGREQWELGGGQLGKLLACPEPYYSCVLSAFILSLLLSIQQASMRSSQEMKRWVDVDADATGALRVIGVRVSD